MAQRYAIASRTEAAAYLAHPLLGPRLRECARLVTATEGGDECFVERNSVHAERSFVRCR